MNMPMNVSSSLNAANSNSTVIIDTRDIECDPAAH